MRRQFWAAVPLVLTMLSVCEAQNESRRERTRYGGQEGLVFLSQVEEIQTELGISEKQKIFLEALRRDLQTQTRAIVQDAPQGENGDRRDQIRSAFRKLRRQGDTLVKMVLSKRQSVRLAQVRIQYEGIRAMEREEIAKSLALKSEQVEKIRQLRRGNSNRRTPESLEEAAVALLADKQREDWKKMKGKGFEFPDWLARLRQRALWSRGFGRTRRREP